MVRRPVAQFRAGRRPEIFSFLENKRLAHWLNMGVRIALAILLFAMINRDASIIVAEISRAQI